jgi:hypothetical protein
MAAATAVFTLSPWPKGIDMTQRRLILHGPIAISATASGYLLGGIPITINQTANAGNILGFPGLTKSSPITVYFASRAGKGYIYNWIGVDLWTAVFKNATVAAGQSLTDTNGNLQTCTTGGTANNTAEPAWNTTIGGTTTDGTVTWTNEGQSYGLIQILEQNGTTGALVELANATSIPTAVSGDTIAAQMEFLKG